MGMKGDKPKAKGKRKKAALNRLRTSTKKIREAQAVGHVEGSPMGPITVVNKQSADFGADFS